MRSTGPVRDSAAQSAELQKRTPAPSAIHPQLLASCWTSAGDVMPARGPDYSPIPIRTRIEAVGAAGYVGFGLTRPDLVRARDSIGLGTLAEVLRDNGIRYV